MPTRPMTMPPTVPTCGAAGSRHGSLGGDRVVEPAGAAALADRADPVVAVVLAAPGGPLGPRHRAVVGVGAAGLRTGVLEPAVTGQREATASWLQSSHQNTHRSAPRIRST
jgi:fermentation-respiration switch protein FrsA (DUF1100 family)